MDKKELNQNLHNLLKNLSIVGDNGKDFDPLLLIGCAESILMYLLMLEVERRNTGVCDDD